MGDEAISAIVVAEVLGEPSDLVHAGKAWVIWVDFFRSWSPFLVIQQLVAISIGQDAGRSTARSRAPVTLGERVLASTRPILLLHVAIRVLVRLLSDLILLFLSKCLVEVVVGQLLEGASPPQGFLFLLESLFGPLVTRENHLDLDWV